MRLGSSTVCKEKSQEEVSESATPEFKHNFGLAHNEIEMEFDAWSLALKNIFFKK